MREVTQLREVASEMLSGLHAEDTLKRRILFQAQALEGMPQMADEMLGSLCADPALKHRILVRAAQKHHAPRTSASASRRLSPVMGMAMVMVVMLGIGILYGNPGSFLAAQNGNPVGNVAYDPGFTTNPLGPEISYGSITASGSVPQYKTLFASNESGSPALVSVNGRYYQMLLSPVSLDVKLLGSQLGDIQQRVTDLSTLGDVGIYSNVVGTGDAFFSLDGYSDQTMIAAYVNGTLRLFQRVDYAGNALMGNETFADTLAVHGEVALLELSGVGTINDPAKANALIEMLLEEAVWAGDTILSGDQALTVYLNNKLSLQLNVSGDLISGCGTWACPDFIEAFKQAVAEA